MSTICKSVWIRAIAVVWCSALLCSAAYFLGGKVFFETFVSSSDQNSVLNYYYTIDNHDHNAAKLAPNILIVDISSVQSRTAIAQGIEKIRALNPKKIGIDIIFPYASASTPEQDSAIEAALAHNPNVVMACRIVETPSERYVEHSYFTQKHHLTYGFVNRFGAGRYVDRYSIDNEAIRSLAGALAGGNDGEGKSVNFKNTAFTVVHLTDELDRQDVEGKIVLVGDLEDARDMQEMEFPVNGSYRIPGVVLIAYAVHSFVENNWIVQTPEWLNLLVAALTVYLIALVYLVAAKSPVLGNLLTKLWILVSLVLVTLVGYVVFSVFNLSFSPLFILFGVALIDISNDIVNLIFRPKK